MRSILKFVLVLTLTQQVSADVMNLNDLMPTRLEDATPLEELSFDSQSSIGYISDPADPEMIIRQNFRYGLTKRIQLETYGDIFSGGDERGSGQIHTGGLIQLVEENTLPSMAISPMVVLPTGKYQEGLNSDSKFIITKTLLGTPTTARAQVHFNLNWTHQHAVSGEERTNFYMTILGFSYRYADFQAFVIDLVREEESLKGKESNFLEAGIHQELGQNYFIGLSASVGLGDESPDYQSIFSFEKQFQ